MDGRSPPTFKVVGQHVDVELPNVITACYVRLPCFRLTVRGPETTSDFRMKRVVAVECHMYISEVSHWVSHATAQGFFSAHMKWNVFHNVWCAGTGYTSVIFPREALAGFGVVGTAGCCCCVVCT